MPKLDEPVDNLTEEQGRKLLDLARLTISDKIEKLHSSDDLKNLINSFTDKTYQRKTGTFVTIKINNQLRGCIGNLVSNGSIVNGIQQNALNAAFNDPRFPPLTPEEFKNIDIDISILTEPDSLVYEDPQELLEKIRVGIDGVILRKGMNSSTFLPQVWDQLPDPANFISNLSLKAGLPADIWRREKLDIKIYQVQHFS